MARTFKMIPARLLKRPPAYARIDVENDPDVPMLAESFINRPICPIICDSELTILDGNRRHAGVMQKDPDREVPVCVTDETLTPATFLEIQSESSAQTKSLTPFEDYRAIDTWLELTPGGTAKEFARRTRRNETVICKIYSLSRCVDAVQDAARINRIGYTAWHELSKLPPEQQLTALADYLDGKATRADLASRRRSTANGKAATVKASSIPVMLRSGIAITFKAESLTLSMALDALADLKQELKEAIDSDHDARTFATLMKKRARQLAHATGQPQGA
jgi:hypothetical protein